MFARYGRAGAMRRVRPRRAARMIVFETAAAPASRAGEADGRRPAHRRASPSLRRRGGRGPLSLRPASIAGSCSRKPEATVAVGPADPAAWREAWRGSRSGPVLVGPVRARPRRCGARTGRRRRRRWRSGRPVYLLDPEPAGIPRERRREVPSRSAPGGRAAPSRRFRASQAAAAAGLAAAVAVSAAAGVDRRSPRRWRPSLAAAAAGGAASVTALVPAADGEGRRAIVEARAVVEPDGGDGFFEIIHHGDWSARMASGSPTVRGRSPASAAWRRCRRGPSGRREPPGNAAAAARLEELAEHLEADEHRAALLHAGGALDRRVGPRPRGGRAGGQLPQGLSVRRRDRGGGGGGAAGGAGERGRRRGALRAPAVLRVAVRLLRVRRHDGRVEPGPVPRRARARGVASSRPRRPARAFDSVYLGGGTPSLLPAGGDRAAARGPAGAFAVDGGRGGDARGEPGGRDGRGRRAPGRQAGVNRVSVGVQSLADAELSAVGRRHDAARARAALATLARSGLSISGDLILGLPEPDAGELPARASRASSTPASSTSRSTCSRRRRRRRSRRTGASTRTATSPTTRRPSSGSRWGRRSRRAGLRHYEISNWARPGREARHNVKYWQRAPTLGLGVSAHELWDGRRRANVSNLESYLVARWRRASGLSRSTSR